MRETLIHLALGTVMYVLGGLAERRRRAKADAKLADEIFAAVRRDTRAVPSPVTLRLEGFPDDASAAEMLIRATRTGEG